MQYLTYQDLINLLDVLRKDKKAWADSNDQVGYMALQHRLMDEITYHPQSIKELQKNANDWLKGNRNICNNVECADIPDESRPCSRFVLCTCGWPAAAEKHCKGCQHQESCHKHTEKEK